MPVAARPPAAPHLQGEAIDLAERPPSGWPVFCCLQGEATVKFQVKGENISWSSTTHSGRRRCTVRGRRRDG